MLTQRCKHTDLCTHTHPPSQSPTHTHSPTQSCVLTHYPCTHKQTHMHTHLKSHVYTHTGVTHTIYMHAWHVGKQAVYLLMYLPVTDIELGTLPDPSLLAGVTEFDTDQNKEEQESTGAVAKLLSQLKLKMARNHLHHLWWQQGKDYPHFPRNMWRKYWQGNT